MILKALADVSDVHIYNRLVKGHVERSDIHDRVEVLLRGAKTLSLNSKEECLAYLGRYFRINLGI